MNSIRLRSRPRRSARAALFASTLAGLALGAGCGGYSLLDGLPGPFTTHARPPQLGGIPAVEGEELLDPSFAGGGLSGPSDLRVEALLFDRLGGLLVGGRNRSGRSADLLRLTPSGAADLGFGTGGRVRLEDELPVPWSDPFPGGLPSARAILVDGLDRVLVASAAMRPGEGELVLARALVVRLEPDGTPDPTFGVGGRVELDPSEAPSSTTAIDLVEDGAGGLFVLALELVPREDPRWPPTPRAFVARLDADGAPVSSFGIDGHAHVPAGEPCGAAALVRDALGRPVLLGERLGDRARLALWRFLPDGALDPSFGQGGEVLVDGSREYPTLDLRAVDLVRDADGGLLVAVQRLSDPGLADGWPHVLHSYEDGEPFECSGALWRFSSEGVLDPSFGAGGSTRLATSSGPYVEQRGGDRLDLCAGLALDAAGRILVVGDSEPAKWYDDTGFAVFQPPHAALFRLLPDGALDPTLGGAGAVVIGETAAYSEVHGRPRAIAVDGSGSGRVALAGFDEDGTGRVWCLAPSAGP